MAVLEKSHGAFIEINGKTYLYSIDWGSGYLPRLQHPVSIMAKWGVLRSMEVEGWRDLDVSTISSWGDVFRLGVWCVSPLYND